MAHSLLDRGRWDETLAIATRKDRDWVSETPVALSIEALVRARRGESRAHDLLERAWQLLREIPESARHGTIRAALVEAARLRDDRREALAQLRAARESASTPWFARSAGDLALWGARLGLPREAPSGAPAAMCLELAGDWRALIEAWQELQSPYEAALAALPGDDRAARWALTTLHRLGATGAARAFARERAARGARPARWPWLQPPPDEPRVPGQRREAVERETGMVRHGPPPTRV